MQRRLADRKPAETGYPPRAMRPGFVHHLAVCAVDLRARGALLRRRARAAGPSPLDPRGRHRPFPVARARRRRVPGRRGGRGRYPARGRRQRVALRGVAHRPRRSGAMAGAPRAKRDTRSSARARTPSTSAIRRARWSPSVTTPTRREGQLPEARTSAMTAWTSSSVMSACSPWPWPGSPRSAPRSGSMSALAAPVAHVADAAHRADAESPARGRTSPAGTPE